MYSVEVRDRIMIAHSLPDPFLVRRNTCMARRSWSMSRSTVQS